MANVVLCSELERGLHLMAKLADCATELRNQRHAVRVVCADITAAHQIKAFKKASIFQAPKANIRGKAKNAGLFNYSSLLLQQGYDKEENLTPVLRAWLHMLATLDADLVITDHSPTALLAAKLLMTPCVMIGTGYTVPPCSTPVASILPWKNTGEDAVNINSRLHAEDHKLMKTVNASIKALNFDKVELSKAQDIYSHAAQWIMSIPEIDHYGRRDGPYVVRGFKKKRAQVPVWPSTTGEKIFVSMNAQARHLDTLLSQLKERGDPVLAIVPNATKAQIKELSGGNILMQRQPVDMPAVYEQCRIFVNDCSHDQVYELISAGIPPILLPSDAESVLLAYRVAKCKLGFPGPTKPGRLDINGLIEKVSKNDQVWANASRISLKYENYDSLHRLQDLIAAKLPKY